MRFFQNSSIVNQTPNGAYIKAKKINLKGYETLWLKQ